MKESVFTKEDILAIALCVNYLKDEIGKAMQKGLIYPGTEDVVSSMNGILAKCERLAKEL